MNTIKITREPTGIIFSSNILVSTEFRNHINESNSMGLDNYSVPCRLSASAGFVRGWFSRVNGLQTTLNARSAGEHEQPHAINGILTAYYNSELVGYSDKGGFVEVDHKYFKAVGWQNLPPKHIPIYLFRGEINYPPDRDFPILQSAIDEVLLGFLENGEEFAIEFLESTSHWSEFWLNDRRLPRRPWVHQPKYQQLDELLEKHPTASNRNHFKQRKLENRFTTYFVKSPPIETLDASLENLPETSLDSPQCFVFGFGSLINTQSRRTSDAKAADALPVRVSAEAGLYRSWNFQSPTAGLTALGVGLDAQQATSINGVVYPCDNLEAFDQREDGYDRIELLPEHVECLSWKIIPKHAKVWVYIPQSKIGGQAGTGLKLADRDYPILQSYIDVCILGCLEFSREFALEFLQTILDWSQYWLNDRQLARRPWVHQPKNQEIDAIILEALGDKVFDLRKLDVEFNSFFIEGSDDDRA